MTGLRDLPGIDALLREPALAALIEEHGRLTVKAEVTRWQAAWRADGQPPGWSACPAEYAPHLRRALRGASYRRVFNLTGTIIHTNLGRAPLSIELLSRAARLAGEPMTLEYDLEAGGRGHRDHAVAHRLARLAGAESATVVNNCAAALLLVLNTFAIGREVPVSRGELIEIGGSFRLPDIMLRSGCTLVEVGTTNRTHADDYVAAVGPATGCLLKIHPSNYHISGFTRSVPVAALAEIAHSAALPLAVDLGSGSVVGLERWGLPHEPTPAETLSDGADVVMFSGDKLLGSVQAGLVVGSERLIRQLNDNPLKRALRPDKLTLAILQETLKLYETPETLPETLPLLKILLTPVTELRDRAENVARTLGEQLPDFDVSVVSSTCQLGSGSLPDRSVPSIAVRVRHGDVAKVRELERTMRALPIPVIGRTTHNALQLDMRGAAHVDDLARTLAQIRVT